jgi:hypothetical protein
MVNFNAQVCTKVLELPCSALIPVIGDNVIGNAKPVHDFFDEPPPPCPLQWKRQDLLQSTL